jgi:hypothetical protein
MRGSGIPAARNPEVLSCSDSLGGKLAFPAGQVEIACEKWGRVNDTSSGRRGPALPLCAA